MTTQDARFWERMYNGVRDLVRSEQWERRLGGLRVAKVRRAELAVPGAVRLL